MNCENSAASGKSSRVADVFYLEVPKNAATTVDAGFLREPFSRGRPPAEWDRACIAGTAGGHPR